MTYLDEPEDVQWLKETHLKGVPLPAKYADFQSFVIYGNEDAPDRLDLHTTKNPQYCDDYLKIVFEDAPIYCSME